MIGGCERVGRERGGGDIRSSAHVIHFRPGEMRGDVWRGLGGGGGISENLSSSEFAECSTPGSATNPRVPARSSLDQMEEISVGDAERGALGHNKIGLRRRMYDSW